MKRVLIILLGSICFHAHAQNVEKNLKLVGMVTRDTLISLEPGTFAEFQYQVPEGKIWKIENLIFGYNNLTGITPQYEIKINNSLLLGGTMNQYPPFLKDYLPLWLNSGDVLKITNYFNAYQYPFNFRLAGFEFVME
jgi:hypothetical protein